MDEALAGGTPVFEWTHRRPDGALIPTEVRLLRLPAANPNLLRASFIDRTEQRRAQRALQESEEKFRALFEESIEGIVLHDEDQILEANPAAVRILGCKSAEEVIGKHPSDTSPPFQPNGESSQAMANKNIQECMARGSARFEWISRTPEGKLIPLEVTLTRIQWSGRQVIQALINDISQRKQAEHALREANTELHREVEQRTRAEELLRQRVGMSTLNAEVAVALNAGTDLRGMLQRCTELMVQHLDVAFARIWTLNQATETLELQASAGCYTHLDGAHGRVKVGQYKIGLIAQEKKPLLTNDLQSDPRIGDPGWAAREGMVSFAGYPLLIEDRVIGVLAMFARHSVGDDCLKTLGSVADSVALGIERKRAQNALMESEARFSAAFQASPIIIGVLNMSDGKFVLVNDALVNWLGCSRDEALGRTCADLGMWENLGDRAQVLEELSRGGSIRQRECRWRNLRAEQFTVLLSAETITLGNAPHVLLLALDISKRKLAEAELHKTLAREKELGQLRSKFVSMVSHEFRTPLGIIQSSAEILSDYLERLEPGERRDHLLSIQKNTRRMAGLMEEVLLIGSIEAGKMDFKPAVLDLRNFVRRLADEVLSATDRRCPIDLKLGVLPVHIRGDERLLRHIFTNLLTNAIKYSEPGQPVQFEIDCDNSAIVSTIRDRGIGIPEADHEWLFTAFHRGSNVGERPGTGLGLLIVKRCADLHGGKISLKSAPGQGTTATFRLPKLIAAVEITSDLLNPILEVQI